MTFGAGFVSGLLEASLRALALGLLAWAALRLCRVKSAAAQHAVWTLATLGMILLGFRPMLPPVRARVLPPLALRAAADVSEMQAVELPPASRRRARSSTAPAQLRPARPALSRNPWPVASAGVLLYATGAALFLIQLAAGYWLVLRLRRNSRLVRCADGVPVYECSQVSVPMATGCIRPRILLPPAWRAWDEEKLQAALIHERAHIRRADWPVSVLAAVNRSIFWFHPLAWWLERRLAVLAEEACDDATVLATGDRAQYAQTLLDMARAVTFRRGRFSFAGMNMAGHRRMRERIDRVLDETREVGPLLTRRAWAITLSLVLPLLYVYAAFQPSRMVAQIPPPHARGLERPAPVAADAKEMTAPGVVSITVGEVVHTLQALADATLQPAEKLAQGPPSMFRQAEANMLARRATGQPNETTAVEMLADFYSSTLAHGLARDGESGASLEGVRDIQAILDASSDGWLLERTAAILIQSGNRVGAPSSVRIDWQQYPNLSAAVAYGVQLMKRAQQFGEGGIGLGTAQDPPPNNSRYACDAPPALSDYYLGHIKPSAQRVDLLRAALVSDPDNVFLNRWLVATGGGEFRAEYREKLAAHPDDPAYLYYYAQAVMTARWDPATALPYLERSVALAPDFPWNYVLLAHIHSIGAWADQTKLVQDIRAISNLCPQGADYRELQRVHDIAATRDLTARYRSALESRTSPGIASYYPSLWASELRLTPAAQYTEYAGRVAGDLARLRLIDGADPNALSDGEALQAALEHK